MKWMQLVANEKLSVLVMSQRTPVLTYVMAPHPVDAKHHPYRIKAAQRGKGKPSSITQAD
jgi:hypothetical protein